MWKWSLLLAVAALPAAVFGQAPSTAVAVANMREDIQGLSERVAELTLRVEQLETDNTKFREKSKSAESSYVTLARLNDALADLNHTLQSTVATSKEETLHQVATQIEKLAVQTNAALAALAKGQATRPPVATTFSDNFSKEGVNYTVQKGDTLAVVAKKTSAKVQDIINANKISDPSRIQVGQTLFIPGGK